MTSRIPGIIAAFVFLAVAIFVPAGANASSDTTVSAPGATFRDCTDGCPEMVAIGPGSFQMGPTEGEEEREKTTDRERTYSAPRHLVTIGYKFALGKYDVTRAEFSAFVRETGYQAGSDCRGYATSLEASPASALPGMNWRNPGFPQTDRDPVVCVNRDDVHAYLSWLSEKTRRHYRLPSEAEWEYVARAGTSSSRYWGDGTADACRYANVADVTYASARKIKPEAGRYFDCSDGYVYTSPVGSFLPNGFGLYDTLGNVFQLVEDCLNYDYHDAPTDGSAWLSGDCIPRMARGGSYRKLPKVVRSAFRFNIPGFIRSDEFGFRVARDF